MVVIKIILQLSSFKAQTDNNKKEKRLSKCDVMILVEHLWISNNKKMENKLKRTWKSCFDNFSLN